MGILWISKHPGMTLIYQKEMCTLGITLLMQIMKIEESRAYRELPPHKSGQGLESSALWWSGKELSACEPKNIYLAARFGNHVSFCLHLLVRVHTAAHCIFSEDGGTQ